MATDRHFSCCLVGEGSLLTRCGEELLARGHAIRSISSPSSGVKEWARARGIDCGEALEALECPSDEPFEYLFSIVNYRMLPPSTLQAPSCAAINFHDSPLPQYAGLNATSWAILNGETMHGVSWHIMEKEADTGAILATATVAIESDDTAYKVNLKCYEAAFETFQRLLEGLESDSPSRTEQDLSNRTYFGISDRPRFVVLWTDSAQSIARLVRATDLGNQPNSFGVAKVLFNDEVVIARAVEILDRSSGAAPGTLLSARDVWLEVAVGDGDVRLRLVTPFGFPLHVADLLARHGLATGDILPTPGPEHVSELESWTRDLIRSEPFWIKRLVNLIPVKWPVARSGALTLGERGSASVTLAWSKELATSAQALIGLDITDVLTAATLAFIARVSGENFFDIAFRQDGARRPHGVCPWLPMRAPDISMSTFADYAAAVAAERRKISTAKGFQDDLFARRPDIPETQYKPWSLPLRLSIDIPRPDVRAEPGVDIHVNTLTAELSIALDHSTLADSAELIEALNTFILRLLENPDARVDTTPLQNDRAQKRWVSAWNETGEVYPANIGADQLFAEQARRSPGAIAIRHGDRSCSYSDLEIRVRKVAAQLDGAHIGPGDFVGVFLERSIDLIAALLGVMRSGAAYVPLDKSYPASRIDYMLRDSGASAILTQVGLVELLKPHSSHVLILDEHVSPLADHDHENRGGDDIAYALYTSGSTGEPKGVLVSRRNLTNLLFAHRREVNFSASDSTFALATVCFDIFATEALTPLICGGTVDMISSADATDGFRLRELIETLSPTVLQATPATWRMLIAAGWTGREDLRMVSTGEALPPALADQLLERCPNLWNFYGPTETTVFSSSSRVRPGRPITIGRPLANTQLYVLDYNLLPLPAGAIGELYIGGDGLAAGYLNKPELTDRAFIPNPIASARSDRLYRTGDTVRMLPEGEIEYLGRADAQVKIRGFRIELGEVEHALCAHPSLAEAVVMVKISPSGESQLVAYARASGPNEAPEISRLRAFLGERLPSYMIPARFTFLTAFPLTASGKIDKRALLALSPEPTLPDIPDDGVSVDYEAILTRAWQKALGHGDFSVTDNFFDCGGDSVMMIALLAGLGQRLGRKLGTLEILRHPTIETFARRLETLDGGSEGTQSYTPSPIDVSSDRFARFARLRLRAAQAREITVKMS